MIQEVVRRVPLREATLEVVDSGQGEPLVLIQTALVAEEFRPLCHQPVLREHFRLLRYHRRGYAGSSAVTGAGSIQRDVRDCAELVATLGLSRVHVFGASYSAAVAMTLAACRPDLVRSLVISEPPPLHVAGAGEFLAANARLIEDYQRLGPRRAVDGFLQRVIGRSWRHHLEQRVPDVTAQVDADSVTFFGTDLPALLGWQFGPEQASRIQAPVLHIGGTHSGPWFGQVREKVLEWLPHAEDLLVEGADHSVTLTHAGMIAPVIARFLRQHGFGTEPG